MNGAYPNQKPEYTDTQFHLMLLAGRLLLQNSAATDRVYQAIYQLAQIFQLEVRLFVDYKVITLTTRDGDEFYSRFSKPIPSMTINMTLITQVFNLIEQLKKGTKTPEIVVKELEKMSQISPQYHRGLLIIMLGITAGSLSRIFEGDLPACLIAALGTIIGVIIRQELGKIDYNPFLLVFLAAFIGGLIGGMAIQRGWTSTPEICLLVPSMMLVPGVHLINGILDLVKNHIVIGIARLGLSLVTLSSITFGLLLSAGLTNTLVSVKNSNSVASLNENILLAGLVAGGFAISFNVPKKMLWACVLCGIIGYGLRLGCIHSGLGIIWGNLIASIGVGMMALYFSRRFHAPKAAIAFGAVVGMVPGIFIFRACSGLVQIMDQGANTSLPLLADTIAFSSKALLMTLAIPVGLTLPSLVFLENRGMAKLLRPE